MNTGVFCLWNPCSELLLMDDSNSFPFFPNGLLSPITGNNVFGWCSTSATTLLPSSYCCWCDCSEDSSKISSITKFRCCSLGFLCDSGLCAHFWHNFGLLLLTSSRLSKPCKDFYLRSSISAYTPFVLGNYGFVWDFTRAQPYGPFDSEKREFGCE